MQQLVRAVVVAGLVGVLSSAALCQDSGGQDSGGQDSGGEDSGGQDVSGQDAPAPAPATEDSSDPDAAPAPQIGDADFYGAILGDYIVGEMDPDNPERVIYAVGGRNRPIFIRQPGFELRCESVVIWGAKKSLMAALNKRDADEGATADDILGPVIHAIYAEGAVTMKRDQQLMRGDRLLLDFQSDQAYLVNAQMRGISGESETGRRVPLSVRADIVRGTATGKYKAENAVVTTCLYEQPHYKFATATLDLDFTEEYVSFMTGWGPTLSADTSFGDDVPIMVLPIIGGSAFDLQGFQDIVVGSSDRFGTSVEVTWGGDLEDDEGSKWADWRLHTDYRSRRGAGTGVDFNMEGEGEKGRRDQLEIESYYQRDSKSRDKYSERPFDGGLGDSNSKQRGRLRAFFRQHGGAGSLLPEGWRLDGGGSLYSDRGFLPEYQRSEVQMERQQETYLSATKLFGNQGFSALASTRPQDEAVSLTRSRSDLFLTDYATQTDYLPSLTYHVVDETLLPKSLTGFAPLGLSVQASVASVKRNWDGETRDVLSRRAGWRAERVTRGDLETRLHMPFSMGPINISPAVGGSYMAVDEANGFANNNLTGKDVSSEDRYSGFWSLRVGTEIRRNFDLDVAGLSVHGLRHVMSFDTQYFDRFSVSEKADTFQVNDMIDSLDGVRMTSLRVRNRLQTKRDGEVVDWLDYETRYLNFLDDFNAKRSKLGYREDLAQPLQRLDFAGQDKYAGSKSGSAYLQHRARLALLPKVWLVGEADYDMDKNENETSLAGVRLAVDDNLSFYTGRRTIRGDSRIWTFRTDYRISKKWIASLYQQENTRSNKRFDTRVTLYRRAHDFTIAVEVRSDAQLNDQSFSVAIYPNDWLGGGGDPFSKKRDLDYEALRWYR